MPQSTIPALQLAFRAAAAAVLALAAAKALGLRFPLYAMIAAVIVTDLEPAETRSLSIKRLTGTLLGTGIGAVLSLVPSTVPAVSLARMGVGIFAAMFGCALLGLKEATKVSGYVCGIVLLEHASEPWSYALYRLIETTLGIAAAVLVSLVPMVLRSPPRQ